MRATMCTISGVWMMVLACAAPPPAPADKADTGVAPTPSEPAEDTPLPEDTSVAPDTDLDPLGIVIVEAPDVVPVGDVLELIVQVSGAPGEEVTVTVYDPAVGMLGDMTWVPNYQGFQWGIDTLAAGEHTLQLTATALDGRTATLEFPVGLCEWPAVETFDTNALSKDWVAFGDATWDPQGWLEITGNAQSRAGSIYKTSSKINAGDLRMEFDIATGGGINSGADGYAVNIVDVADPVALADWIRTTQNGGCLGYGSAPPCGATAVNAFHIEFDTWHNSEYNDPTTQNHIAINLDGSPNAHPLWAAVPSLEDLVWRHVEVQTTGAQLRVRVDGQVIIDGTIPGFSFDGGYVGVSGSTGWATNYHRFDNLIVYDRCTVPGPTTP
ncbi:MAG: hypothetical protein RLZZ383_2278 [Pseudomonadota bacterium]|jgi:hypothetical protein